MKAYAAQCQACISTKRALSGTAVTDVPKLAAPWIIDRYSLCGVANIFGVRFAALASVTAEALPWRDFARASRDPWSKNRPVRIDSTRATTV